MLTDTSSFCFSFIGSIGGGISYFAGLFLIAELAYEDGLQNFLVNTSQDYSLLGAIISGFVVSLILTVTTSMVTNKVITSQDVSKVWATTMAIDNPLSPWRAKYKEELRGIGVFDDVRVTLQHMNKMFKVTWRVAGIGGFVSLCLFGVILPACVLSLDVLSFGQYSAWITFCQVWLIIGAIFAIFVPPIEEISQVFRDYKKRIKMNMDSETVANNDYGDEHYSPLKDVIYK